MADTTYTSSGTSPSCLAEQLDEVQLIETMTARDGEFEWRQEQNNGRISGCIQVFLNLDQQIDVCIARKERYVYMYIMQVYMSPMVTISRGELMHSCYSV